MAITQIMNEHERLSILHCLAAMDDYAANNSIIQSVCAQYGNTMTMDKIGTHLFWLKEQGLVTTPLAFVNGLRITKLPFASGSK